MLVPQRVGGQAPAASGDPGRVAEGAGHLAVPGAHLQLSRHHVADAGGKPALHRRGQDLERRDEDRGASRSDSLKRDGGPEAGRLLFAR